MVGWLAWTILVRIVLGIKEQVVASPAIWTSAQAKVGWLFLERGHDSLDDRREDGSTRRYVWVWAQTTPSDPENSMGHPGCCNLFLLLGVPPRTFVHHPITTATSILVPTNSGSIANVSAIQGINHHRSAGKCEAMQSLGSLLPVDTHVSLAVVCVFP